jgi:hypothetical protein
MRRLMSAGALFDLPVSPFWRGLVGALTSLALLVLAMWWQASSADGKPLTHGMLAGLALACCGAPWLRLFSPPCRLRMCASGWERALRGSDRWEAGSLVVALDTGFSMLLRFDPAGEGPGRGRVWLAVDRRATGPTWHALRCAVYSAPPHPITDLPAERRHPSRTP